jgi:hypothetical protein
VVKKRNFNKTMACRSLVRYFLNRELPCAGGGTRIGTIDLQPFIAQAFLEA